MVRSGILPNYHLLLIFSGNRTRSFVQDFQKNEKFTEIVQSLTPLLDNDKESFSKSILGIDFSSPNGFKVSFSLYQYIPVVSNLGIGLARQNSQRK